MADDKLSFGVTLNGLAYSDREIPTIDTRFRIARLSGVFDYIEYSPRPGEVNEVIEASERHGIPVGAGSFFYTPGRDEPLIEWHLRLSSMLGADVQNIQIAPRDLSGRLLSDGDIAELFMRCSEWGSRFGVTPSFEVHINMWSEEFDRVSRVAEIVDKRGGQFNLTLDHSHCVFKMDNSRERDLDKSKGRTQLDYERLSPEHANNYYDEWLAAGIIAHAHARASAPGNPQNVLARHVDGSFGRGVQYPFIMPRANEWHTVWDAGCLDTWKAITRKLLRHHAQTPASRLKRISAEFIPSIDYGAGAGGAVSENNIACVRWLRQTWDEVLVETQ